MKQGIALVTGASGFIGRQVARQLAGAGWKVIGLGHGGWEEDEWRQWGISEWHRADVLLENMVACSSRPDLIVHCAGGSSVGFSLDHPYQDFQRTVATTAAVLEFMRLHAPEARLVYPSSAGVYGMSKNSPILESQPLAPVSPYGEHKLLVEEMCRFHAREFGRSIAVVRLFSVFGPGLRKQLLWDACSKIGRGEIAFSGTGMEMRDWLYVEDAAKLLVVAFAQASNLCPVVNGGTGKGTTVRDVLTELFRDFKRKDSPQFSGIPRAGDPVSYVADIAAAKAWGWHPEVAWHDGVHAYAEWFRAEIK